METNNKYWYGLICLSEHSVEQHIFCPLQMKQKAAGAAEKFCSKGKNSIVCMYRIFSTNKMLKK